jgi:hypothetical protein
MRILYIYVLKSALQRARERERVGRALVVPVPMSEFYVASLLSI